MISSHRLFIEKGSEAVTQREKGTYGKSKTHQESTFL